MIGLLILAGLAHLGPIWQSITDALRAGEHFALVQVVSPTDAAGRTAVERLDVIAGRPPKSLVVVQTGTPRHALKTGQLVLMPLELRSGEWHGLARTRQPLLVDRANRRAAVGFVKRWRARPADRLEADLDAWIDLIGHPTAIARRLAQHALLGQADHVEAQMNDARLDRLAEPLTSIGLPEAEAHTRIRLLGALGGRAGARRIADRFDRLGSDAVRRVAVGVLARFPSSEALATLKRCAGEASGSLKTRCVRALRSLRGPTP